MLDRLEPGLRPARPPRGALGHASAGALGETAMRAGPDADVILIPPIDQIMAAGSPRPGMVGDLVGRPAGRREPRLGELEHRRRLVLAGQGEGAARMVGEEARAALDGELIEREVLAGQAEGALQLGGPGFDRLARPGIDQVEGIAREVPAGRCDGGDRLVGRMLTAEEAQRWRIERLHAQRHAIDAGLGQRGEAAGFDRGRIGFKRDLDLGGGVPQRLGAFDHRAHGRGIHQRRRAAAEEDRLDPAARRLARGVLQFLQQGGAPAVLLDALAHMGVEVAVGALRFAERPMDVDAQGRAHRKQASTSSRKARPRWLMAFFSASVISAVVRVSPSGWKQGS